MKLACAAIVSAVCSYAVLALCSAPVARAGDDYRLWECEDLWTERNTIFKASGYCFASPRAIKQFGNAGCQYDSEADVPLSDNQRANIRAIRSAEKQNGC